MSRAPIPRSQLQELRKSREYKSKLRDFRNTCINRQNNICFYCFTKMDYSFKELPSSATLDHIIPLKYGGRHRLSNCVACCRSCNMIKSDAVYREDEIESIKIAFAKYVERELNNETFKHLKTRNIFNEIVIKISKRIKGRQKQIFDSDSIGGLIRNS